jgi:hypothetical protein
LLAALATALVYVPASAIERSALTTALETITTHELQQHVTVLADDTFEGREAGSRGGRAAGHYLLQQFQEMGLRGAGVDGGYDQPFGGGFRNILGMLAGSDPERMHEIVVLGAHYDHVGYGSRRNSRGPVGYIHNGADDNASGTSVLLEVAQACVQLPTAAGRTILFALWDGEEKGLLGSKHWIEQPTLAPSQRVRFAINLDMVGRLDQQGVQVFGTRSACGLRRMVSRENDSFSLRLDFPWEVADNSDHHTFFVRRIPFLMFHTGEHEDYHRPSDDAEKINSSGMHSIAQLVTRILLRVADRPDPILFRPASQGEGAGEREQYQRHLPPLPPRLGVRWSTDQDGEPGLRVESVTVDSAADRAGIRPGDRLLRFAGNPIVDESVFRRDVRGADSPVTVVVERADAEQPLSLTVELTGSPSRLGIAWRTSDAEPQTVYLVRVEPGLPGDQAGLRPGDRVYEIAGHSFSDSQQFQHLVKTLPLPIELLVERHGRLRWVTLSEPVP